VKLNVYGTALAITLSSVVASANQWNSNPDLTRANQAYGSDYNCTRMRYPFVLNKANVNAVVALACIGVSYGEKDRLAVTYENGSSLFHQWKTTGSSSQIHVEGYCAIPLPDLKDDKLDHYKIDITFTKENAGEHKMKIKTDGTVAGRSIDLNFMNNSFLDNSCPGQEANFSRLQDINVGLSTRVSMQNLINILKGGHLGNSMHLAETETWTQGTSSTSFSGIGVQYILAEGIGRRSAVVATSDESSSILSVRSANFLDYEEGSSYFGLVTDDFGQVTGFQDSKAVVNHKFQAESIAGGSQVVGCSALIFDGELDPHSVEIDMATCKQHIAQSGLEKWAEKGTGDQDENQRSPEEQQEIERLAEARKLADQAQSALDASIAPHKYYSDRPNTFETGRAAWTQKDIARGFVVQQRDISVNAKAQTVTVTEHRSNAQGVHSVKKYTKTFAELHLN
jgi:hypothetical protein